MVTPKKTLETRRSFDMDATDNYVVNGVISYGTGPACWLLTDKNGKRGIMWAGSSQNKKDVNKECVMGCTRRSTLVTTFLGGGELPDKPNLCRDFIPGPHGE